MNVLFVCTGNTCRSPMAAALFLFYHQKAKAESAGLSVTENVVCENAVTAMKGVGIDISNHKPKQLTEKLADAADLIVCMSDPHRYFLASFGVNPEKITVLNVSDPYGGDLYTYQQCRDEIAEKVKSLELNK